MISVVNGKLLFLALAGSLGYEARLVRGSIRDYGPFDPNFTDPYFLRTYSVAVKVGDAWKFCDPASASLPFGMLRWNEQGQTVLVTDGKQPQLVTTPMAAPEASLARREATFRLSGDGTLEGDVRTSYTAESAYARRDRFENQSAANREESVREEVKSRFAAAEVSAVKVTGVSGRGAPRSPTTSGSPITRSTASGGCSSSAPTSRAPTP